MVCKYCYAENADVFIGITARSNAFLDYEKYIHQTFYPYIIHPHSRFRVYWEVYFSFHVILRLAIVCVAWAVLNHENITYQIVILAFQAVNVLEIVLMFFTGYVESKTNTVVLEPKKIACRYLTRFFIFDLIAVIPFDFLLFIFDSQNADSEGGNAMTNSSTTCSPPSFLCPLARFPIFTLYLINLSRILIWDHFKVGMILIWALMSSVVLFASNFYLCQLRKLQRKHIPPTSECPTLQQCFTVPISRMDMLTSYLNTVLLIVLDSLFFDIRYAIESNLLKFMIINLTFIGSALFMVFFINYVIMRMKNHEVFVDVEAEVRTFVTVRHFSSSLRNKAFLYFRILRENKNAKDDEVFNYIPDTFKGEIFYHLCLPLLKNFYCFEELPTFVLRRLAESLNYQLYLPNELVMSKEEPVLKMYFVLRGTVAFYSSKGFELYHFEAGSNFNGRNFVLGELVNTNYAISTEVTEVYRLNHSDFLNIMDDFPKLFADMKDKLLGSRRESSYLID